ncbi:hypothetical protein EF902_28270 [Streptomyces sp. WAC05858]|nr:hypothetical protein EF902_28270 [Streptomyces sp. WAC05858]
MPGHGTPGPFRNLQRKRDPLIDLTSLFSAPEGQPRRSTAAALPLPTTNPFQAPDFGEDGVFPLEGAPGPVSGMCAARPKAA